MSNNELNEYKKTLESNFENLKKQITTLCAEVEKINAEYIQINEELNIRKGK